MTYSGHENNYAIGNTSEIHSLPGIRNTEEFSESINTPPVDYNVQTLTLFWLSLNRKLLSVYVHLEYRLRAKACSTLIPY